MIQISLNTADDITAHQSVTTTRVGRKNRAIFTCCIECRRGLAMRKLSVCPSVSLSVHLLNAWIVTKQKKDLSRFLYHTKDHLA